MIEYYIEMAYELGIQIIFLGEKSYVQPYYELSDYVINVSGGSGVSNSLIETLSSGRPVITWNNKTFTQVIKEGVNGILCSHRNEISLANGIKTAINKDIEVSEDVIRKSAAGFQWEKVVTKWQQVLKD